MKRNLLFLMGVVVALGLGASVIAGQAGQQNTAPRAAAPPKWAKPTPVIPLFFREIWRQVTPIDESSGYDSERPLTAAAVTNANLELKIYDPLAPELPALAKNPPRGSIARDFSGSTCVQLAGYNQNPPPPQVLHGEPTDPANLWTGACLKPVAVTLRDKTNFVDLTGLAKIRWVTRVSGFHVVRPVVKLADGTYLVGDYAEGTHATNSTAFLESEFPIAPIRWLRLDPERIITRGTWVEKPDLTKVDEVGWADLLPGSGHGWGGFVNVAKIEVYGRPVKR
jgi:hypothetical protein